MLQPIHFRKDLFEIFAKTYGFLIVYRFRDNRQKHQHGRLNSYRGDYTTHIFLERSSRDLSINVWVVALIVYRFRDKQSMLQPHTFLDRSRKDLSKNMWVVALIFNRFRDKRIKPKQTKRRRLCSSEDVAL